MIKNLLQDTLAVMHEHCMNYDDVTEVQYTNEYGVVYGCPWDVFAKAAEKVEYDDDFGHPEINTSLMIIFNDESWMERSEYDGREWWSYRRCPPSAERKVDSIDEVQKHLKED